MFTWSLWNYIVMELMHSLNRIAQGFEQFESSSLLPPLEFNIRTAALWRKGAQLNAGYDEGLIWSKFENPIALRW